jgi:hypothetical protein
MLSSAPVVGGCAQRKGRLLVRRTIVIITVVALVVAAMLASSLSAAAKKPAPTPAPAPAPAPAPEPAPAPAPAPAPEPAPAPAPDTTEPSYTCAAIGCDPNFDWESFCDFWPDDCLNM